MKIVDRKIEKKIENVQDRVKDLGKEIDHAKKIEIDQEKDENLKTNQKMKKNVNRVLYLF